MYLGPAESMHDLQDRVARLFGEQSPGAGICYRRFNGGMDLIQGDQTLECNLRATKYSNGFSLYIPIDEASWPQQGTYEIANEVELPSNTSMPSGFDTLKVDRDGEAVSLQYGKKEAGQGLNLVASHGIRNQRELETLLTYNISHQLSVQLSRTETRRTYTRADQEGKITNRKSVVLNWYQGKEGVPSVTTIIENHDHVWEATYDQSGSLVSMTKYATGDSRTQIALINFNSQQELAAESGGTENHPKEEAEARTALWDNFKITPDVRIDSRTTLDEITNNGKVVLEKKVFPKAGRL